MLTVPFYDPSEDATWRGLLFDCSCCNGGVDLSLDAPCSVRRVNARARCADNVCWLHSVSSGKKMAMLVREKRRHGRLKADSVS